MVSKIFSRVKLLLIFTIILPILSSGCLKKTPAAITVLPYITQKLPISERKFYIGFVPNPASAPKSTFNDIIKAYEEAREIAEISVVWVAKQSLGEYELLKKNRLITAIRVYGLKPLITLNFATLKQSQNGLEYVIDAPSGINPSLSDLEFRQLWKNEAKKIAQEFRPEYFSLGNEINDYFYFHPDEFETYLSLVKQVYNEIKSVCPDTKVLVVLSYNHLIENNQWDMLTKLDSCVDLIGLTTYPYKKFSTPDDIPIDYYSRLKQYITKPVAFTEIGWSSTGKNTEKIQADFLIKFLELTKGLDIEMINWLFLHETTLTGIIAQISHPDVTTIALKRPDGRKKEVYDIWVALKQLKRR